MTAARAKCSSCEREILLTADGGLRKHKDGDGKQCTGGQPISGEVTIGLPWPKPPLAQNDRQHWTAKARSFAAAKAEARWAIRAARVGRLTAAEVTLHYQVPNNRVRDVDGPAPTLKVVLDALVDEQVIPADHWHHVPAATIRIHPPIGKIPGSMWVTLVPVAAYDAAVG